MTEPVTESTRPVHADDPARKENGVPTTRLVEALRASLLENERIRIDNERLVAQATTSEPIAIVGMACRYPGGADTPDQLWQLLVQGRDAVGPFPDDRGWLLPRSSETFSVEGGFLDGAGDFDPAFFAISPSEALAMDPQQRLLLEVCWEAIEQAGIDPRSLRGSATATFAGAIHGDYAPRFGSVAPEVAGYLGTGTTASILSGRVAYALGLQGPTLTIDTACSSSLVAIHLAASALRGDECSLALAGGVTVMSTPSIYAGLAGQGGLAPDGRCKSFAAAADGAGFGEGAGIVVMERLSRARAHGHPVLAVLRGSAVNSDGASNGLTAPSGPAQQRVIGAALADAGLAPGDVDAVEAHGTGTTLGDPIEAQALLATYGRARPAGRPLWLGSFKSNIGHAGAAAGVAGVIKTVMALRHGLMPRTLHVQTPTSYVDWSSGTVRLLTERTPWPQTGGPRRAAVSAFGVSGTNAHVVLEQATPAPLHPSADPDGAESQVPDPDGAEPQVPDPDGAETQVPVHPAGLPVPFLVSGRSAAALRAQAGRLIDRLDTLGPVPLESVGRALALNRSSLEHRAVVLVGDRASLLTGLGALARGENSDVVQGVVAARGRTVFVFPGQGSQWTGMAQELIRTEPVFAAAMAACGRALAPHVEWGLTAVLGDESALARVDVVQPVLFSVMVSLAALWRSVGIEPDAVVGHSQGEIAAAHVAGGLTLADAAMIVARRSQALAALAGQGAMASVSLPEAELRESIAPWGERLSIAALNGPSTGVLSGDPAAIDEIVAALSGQNVRAQRIPVDYAAHSAQVEQVQARLSQALAAVRPQSGSIAFFSTVEGAWTDTAQLDAEYWYRNLRAPVRFAAATSALLGEGYRYFLEASPHPVLTYPVQQSAEVAGLDAHALSTLRRGDGGSVRFRRAVAEAHVAGLSADWATLFTGPGSGQPVELPTYAFQRRRYWLEPGPRTGPVPAGANPVTERFWDLVRGGDVAGLAGELGIVDDAPLSAVLPSLADWDSRRAGRSATDRWRYQVQWQALPSDPAPDRLTGSWLLLVPRTAASTGDRTPADHQETLAELVAGTVAALTRAGASVITMTLDPDRTDRAGLARRLRDLMSAATTPVTGLLSLLGLDERPHPEHPAAPVGLALSLSLIQAYHDVAPAVPLWWATRQAVRVDGSDTVVSAAQNLIWGIGRVAALEYPQRFGGLIDLPARLDDASGAALAGALAAGRAGSSGGGPQDQLAVRAGAVLSRRLARVAPSSEATPIPTWIGAGTVLITGGTGAVGAHVARWLAGAGATHLVLVGRRGEDAPGAGELRAELTALGTRVSIAACDVTDRDAVAALVAGLAAAGDPVRSVIHAAGSGRLVPLAETDLAEFAATLGAKVLGAAHLDDVLAGTELAAFVLFSSISSVWGSAAHGAYAAANAYLDGLAESRQARGLPATSVVWGIWDPTDGGGMATDLVEAQLAGHGVLYMPPALAVRALAQVVGGPAAVPIVADIDWERFATVFTAMRPSPLIEALPEVRAALADARAGGGGVPDEGLRGRLRGLDPADRDRLLVDLVQAQAAGVLGHDSATAVEPGRAFRDLGFDSLTAVELRNRLNTATGLRLPVAVIFDYSSVGALARHLGTQLAGDEAAVPAARSSAVSPAVAVAAAVEPEPVIAAAEPADPIVIVAMSCRYPGGVRTPEDLWDVVAEGRDVISALPIDRGWPAELYDPDPDRPGRSYVTGGGFLDDAGAFDPQMFGISPREALAMDPQQRLLLTIAWEALERAGIDPTTLIGAPVGVFAGAAYQGYGSAGTEVPTELEGLLIAGVSTSVLSGRVAYTLGLRGPVMTIDTACSSSLVALHLAAQALRAGECTMALAGGVTVLGTSMSFTGFSRQRGLAPDGRCKSFAAAADGFGLAEGAGLVLLERLSRARELGHPVLAVLAGSAVNSDGASNGLTAPSGLAQQELIRSALADAGLDGADVDVVEAHGTGTRLGDPIEAEALLAVYGRAHTAEQPLRLGSVKSNLGHTQAASGVAGVIKMVEAMRHELLPQTLHVDEPSANVDWSPGTVTLLTAAAKWENDGFRPRRAGVSSFGLSGTNAHVILEQPPSEPGLVTGPAAGAAFGTVVPWLLSARTGPALVAQARKLRDQLLVTGVVAPADIAVSLATGRSQFAHRAVVTGADPAELISGLEAMIAGRAAPGVAAGVAGPEPRVVMVFPGQGSQWPRMAVDLLDTSPVFAASIAECERALRPHLDWSLSDVLQSRTGAAALDRVDVVQPVLFAVMVSLAALWRSVGVRPAGVIGHSQGEIAAACVAGAISLDDAARIVARRSRALLALTGKGGMVFVPLPAPRVAALLAAWGDALGIAAVNGPTSVVVSGAAQALAELTDRLADDGVLSWAVPGVDFAGHSTQVEQIRGELEQVLAGVAPRGCEPVFYSAVTGTAVDPAALDAGYWYRNLREPVRFAAAATAAAAAGNTVFLEVSPHPVLTVWLQETLEADQRAQGLGGSSGPVAGTGVTGTLRRDDGGPARFLTSLGQLHSYGVPVDWAGVLAGTGGRPADLPTYAFQEERFWLVPSPSAGLRSDPTGPATNDRVAERFWTAVGQPGPGALADTLQIADPGTRVALDLVAPVLARWHRGQLDESVQRSWRYQETWRALPARPAAVLTGTWWLIAPDRPDRAVQGACRAVLTAAGAEVRLLTPASLDRAGLARQLSDAAADLSTSAPAGVLSLLGLDERAHAEGTTMTRGLTATLALIQALGEAEINAPLWCVTRSAVSIGRSDRLTRSIQALIWGLGGVAAVEYPDRFGGVIDLPEDLGGPALARLPAVLTGLRADATGPLEDQVALRGAGTYGRRLRRSEPAGSNRARPGWTPTGTVLITGGTGALGGHLARWLARTGAEHLLLLSRRGRQAPEAAALADELTAFGAEVSIVAVDAADPAALAAVLAAIPAQWPLRSVFHTAGVLDDGLIDTLTPQRAAAVLRPKVDAVRALDTLTRDLDLTAFVLFSSLAGTLGGAGQGAYAAANAVLDALAQERRAAGRPATSVAWGLWGGQSLAGADVAARLIRNGLPAMDPQQAIGALQQALNEDETRLVIADFAWDRFLRANAGSRSAVLLRDLPEAQTGPAIAAAGPEELTLVAAVAAAPAAKRPELLADLVRAQVCVVLNLPDPDAIGPDQVFRDLGFDSLTAVELRDQLSAATGVALSVTIAFDYPTTRALVAHLQAELEPALPGAGLASSPVRAGAAAADRPTAAVQAGEPENDVIAIVAMSCRYPGGVSTPEELWQLVASGTDAIAAFPTNRGWDLDRLYDPDPEQVGTTYAKEGGFLYEADHFDPVFFGISPREAVTIDPQQRLLLELAWETLERAGVDPLSLAGSRSGVFIGASYDDYGMRMRTPSADYEGYLGIGSAGSVASGRIAYTLGLEGPTLTVDTACSSSLVAMHLAAQALRSGECTLALAGGVTVMANPDTFVEFSRQRGLAPDGRCKPFAAAADGTAWGEGAGMVLLERLSDARANGHPVLALVRACAVNSDGASNGLTAPNGPSQQRVIRQALAQAGLATADVDAVEAHGTGTKLGDPIEAQALIATYGQDREPGRPLLLGSLKSNIGHTQAASGVAGVIKMVMAMRHGVLPPTLHLDRPTPYVNWDAGEVRLLPEAIDWPATGRPRRAGVSSFGVSGTNVHMILEQGPDPVPAGAAVPSGRPGTSVWTLSGRGAAALAAQARGLLTWLADGPDPDPVRLGHALATTRSAFTHRAAVVGGDTASLTAAVSGLAEGRAAVGLVQGVVPAHGSAAGRTAFLFPGQGSQRAGMGAGLYARFPVFAEAFDAVCAAVDPYLDRPLHPLVLDPASDADQLARTEYTQPALFALGVAGYRLLEHWGIAPDVLIGHSIGELAAAHVAGVLSLPDAAALVAARGRLMQAMPAGGVMVSLMAAADEVQAVVDAQVGRQAGVVDVAAVNGPHATVVSGDSDAVAAVVEHFRARGRKSKQLRVSHAFHSAHMDGMLAPFRAVAEGLTYAPPAIPVVSNLTGALATAAELASPGYWVRHVRESVRFRDGVQALLEFGVTRFLELGPDGALTAMTESCLPAGGPDPVLVPLLTKDGDEVTSALSAVAALQVNGVDPDWDAVFADLDPRARDEDGRLPVLPALPTYPFQRARYWLEPSRRPDDVGAAGLHAAGHPLLGAALELAGTDTRLFVGRLSSDTQPWLGEHRILGGVLFPATAFLDLAIRVGDEVGLSTVGELTLGAPLPLPDRGGVVLQVRVDAAQEDGSRALSMYSRPEGADADQEWARHATGLLTRGARPEPGPVGSWPPAGATALETEGLYARFAQDGFAYGPAFQGLRGAWRLGDSVYAEAELPAGQRGAAPDYGLHPALLDSALHALAFGLLRDDVAGWLPFSWTGVRLHAAGAGAIRLQLTPVGQDSASVLVTDTSGQPVLTAALALRPVEAAQIQASRAGRTGTHDDLYRLEWTELSLNERPRLVDPNPAAVAGSVVHRFPAGPITSTGSTDPVANGPAELVTAAATELLVEIQAWLGRPELPGARFVLVTTGAVETVPGATGPDPVAAALCGLVRSALTENPGRFALLDLDPAPGDDPELDDATVLALLHSSGEDQLAIRGRLPYRPRMVRVPVAAPGVSGAPDEPARPGLSRWNRDGTVLIAGGTGAIGALTARHLVTEHGIGRLILTSRRGPGAPGAADLVAELTGLGAEVRVVACDVGERADVTTLLASVPAAHPLTAVVHAAGALADGLLAEMTPAQLAVPLRAKVAGAVLLEELTRDLDLADFVLFSSVAGVFGSAGQGNYAAANAFLDAIAQRRRAQRRPGRSLAWGLWANDSGMSGGLGVADLRRIARSGVLAFTPEQGLAQFDVTAEVEDAVVMPLRLDLKAVASGRGEVPALLRGLARTQDRRAAAGVAGPDPAALRRRIIGLAPAARDRALLDLVRGHAATVLGFTGPQAVDPLNGLLDQGFDSLTAVELRNVLGAASGLRLPATLLFDHPTPTAIAAFLASELVPPAEGEADPDPGPAPTVSDRDVETLQGELDVASGADFFDLIDRVINGD